MPATISYAFCDDYSYIYDCLVAIQDLDENGDLLGNQQLLKLIYVFDKDLLRKLFLRTVRTLMLIDGIAEAAKSYLGGDFDDREFQVDKFHVGYLNLGAGEDTSDQDLFADFEKKDFLALDYYVGTMETSGSGYSSTFKTILNLFSILCSRSAEITEQDKAALDAALIPVLDAFEVIQQYLSGTPFRPCASPDDLFLNNTKNVFLQAAGSDGADGIAEGLHLRWSFTGKLALNHLPRGAYSNNSGQLNGFNRANDFVYIFRTPYENQVGISVDFETAKPIIDFAAKRWTYIVRNQVNNKTISNRIRLTFKNAALYNQIAGSINPETSYFQFLKSYSDIIDLEVVNKKVFLTRFDFRKPSQVSTSALKIEAICQATTDDDAIGPISVRKTLTLNSGNAAIGTIKADNIELIRLKKSPEGYLQSFYAETYHDFLITRSEADWTPVGSGFSLSLNDQQVYERLESPDYLIDNLWPQYNNGTTVRASNYRDKWGISQPDDPSLKELLEKYLVLSENDSRAVEVLKTEDGGPFDSGFSVSYVDVIGLQCLDYHLARMFGLGHIDSLIGTADSVAYVYQLRYLNKEDPNSAKLKNYRYTSLPITKSERLEPEKPSIRPVSYGLPIQDTDVSSSFDVNGYAAFDELRAVNIGRELYADETGDNDFFTDLSAVENSNVFERPKPVFFGVEYRPANQQEYVKPEITNQYNFGTVYYAYDPDYPQTGLPETVPVLDNDKSLYVHFERETGVHFYAIYGISWFARASVLSDEAATDATDFPVKNLLTAPTELTVQYIQKEDQLLLTTAREQTWISGRAAAFPGQDIGLTRITFNWIDIADVSRYQDDSAEELNKVVRPDKANVFFKPELALEVSGIISDIVPVPNTEKQLRLFTGSYMLMDGTLISPAIEATDFPKFTDSLLTTTVGQFRVIGVDTGDVWPVITIEKIAETGTVPDLLEEGSFATQKSLLSPEINSRFTMLENLSLESNWEPVVENVSLISFADTSDPFIESSTDSEGNVTKYWIGGINGEAIVAPLFGYPDAEPGLEGYYKITFDPSVVLLPHPQINIPFDPSNIGKNAPGALRGAHVEWYRGVLRMSVVTEGADKKMIKISRIDNSGSSLVLIAKDETYFSNPIAISTSATDSIPVNFHPGYRAYLFPEPPPQAFNNTNILPVDWDTDRKTLVGIQSADDKPGGTGFVSSVALPAVLLARRIEEPQRPDAPIMPDLKVRPDATGKAALTFDVKVPLSANNTPRNPFGFMFYRTTMDDLLDALYAPETVIEITESLAALNSDPYYNQRIYDLANLVFDPGNPMHFKVYDSEPQYGYPVPDNSQVLPAVGQPPYSDAVKLIKYKAAIRGTLLPLVEQIPIYRFIKQGLQTENSLPVIRDIDGNLLNPSGNVFDGFPMIRKFNKNGVPYVRFTDYNLSGSSRNLYFYCAAEVTNQLVTGEVSPFAGPVSILHTLPSDPPVLRSFSILPPVVPEDEISVVFKISPISFSEQISKIRIYRTTNAGNAGTLQTMEAGPDIDIEMGVLSGYEITDTFSDLPAVPVGRTIYYRLAGVRSIVNEFEELEDVLSHAWSAVAVRLIDTRNPDAPDDINYDQAAGRISWSPTTYNGTYFLYKQNIRGNWERVFTAYPPDTDTEMEYMLPVPLIFEDADGNKIYHRFKVQVQNSSGLMNLAENEVTFSGPTI